MRARERKGEGKGKRDEIMREKERDWEGEMRSWKRERWEHERRERLGRETWAREIGGKRERFEREEKEKEWERARDESIRMNRKKEIGRDECMTEGERRSSSSSRKKLMRERRVKVHATGSRYRYTPSEDLLMSAFSPFTLWLQLSTCPWQTITYRKMTVNNDEYNDVATGTVKWNHFWPFHNHNELLHWTRKTEPHTAHGPLH